MGTAQAEHSNIYEVEQVNKTQKKPNFFKRWFANMAKEAWENARKENYNSERDNIVSAKAIRGIQLGTPATLDQQERAIHFTVYVANGGRIVETRRVDRKTDRSTTGLFIITNDQDFGREIDKIITMESLRG